MSDTPLHSGAERSVWLAALLSFIVPGVGQVYCGRLVRGLTFGLVYGLAIPAAFGLLGYLGPVPTVAFGLLTLVAIFGVVLVAVFDAARLAAETRQDYVLQPYNRPAVYLLIGLMIQGSSIGYALHLRSSLVEAFRVPTASEYPRFCRATAFWPTRSPIGRPMWPAATWSFSIRPPGIGATTTSRGLSLSAGTPWRSSKVSSTSMARSSRASWCPPMPRWRMPAGQVIEGSIYREQNGGSSYKIFVAASDLPSQWDSGPITVPADHCFVLGDNRSNSLDSRQFGPIPYAAVRGRADYIYCPADTWSRFGRIR